MKKKPLLFAASAAAVLLGSCGPFTSHWSAKMFIHSNNSHSASMSFDEFKGLIVFNMRCKDDTYNALTYDLKLTEGKFNISYAYAEDDVKEVITIEGTDTKEGWIALPKEGEFYLLVESEETSKTGNFKFDLKSYSDLLFA